ncbi:lytic transglycosylase domain-containing protein [Rhabdochromatium marinum]|uniref:lytic transglycosylase domain-containing protein n=1 Tax=Rhabdochromatium marinum TaxID=48729 RepID=UPI0019076FDE|nr:lytic transglycosylase domain-containing protein [Rhabdochromatium marinum]MBK1648438.1 hypothetical protein [Rhabdochromatium marinum]
MTNMRGQPLIGHLVPVLLYLFFSVTAVLPVRPALAELKTEPVPATNTADTAAPARPTPPDQPVPSRAELVKLIDTTATKFSLDPALVHAIVRAESNYNPHAVSSAGAIGLMQVMPETAADYGITSAEALFDPVTNARTGARHLKRLLGKYSIGKAVMAYNAGEGALERSNGFVTYPETQVYTHRVLSRYLRSKGVEPYSPEGRQLTGIQLTPAMARALAVARASPGGLTVLGKRLSRLKLRVKPTWLDSPLSKSALDPRMHRAGPESKPMFVLEKPTQLQR